jgi:hypothetical protein
MAMSQTSLVRLRLLALAAALITVMGCGGGSYPVRGKIVFEDDGSPITELEGQIISFDSNDEFKTARGELKADGTFTLTTPGQGEGVSPGKYKVSLTQPYQRPDRPAPKGKPVVATMYERPDTSPLEVVVEQKTNEMTIKLKRLVRKEKKGS